MKRVIKEIRDDVWHYAYVNEISGLAQFEGKFYGTEEAVNEHMNKTVAARKISFKTCSLDKYVNKGKWQNEQINKN